MESNSPVLPTIPEGRELSEWVSEGRRYESPHSNTVAFVSPADVFRLTVEVAGPVQGYLIRLYVTSDDDRVEPIGQTVVDDRELALEVAMQMAAAATDLEAVSERPHLGPEIVERDGLLEDRFGVPGDWDEEEDEWEDALEDAYEKADLPQSKGTLTVKEIDGREYYYLQWREGDKIKSQYVAPVSPS